MIDSAAKRTRYNTATMTEAKPQIRIFLWAVPRSISTAFFRAMMNKSSCKVSGSIPITINSFTQSLSETYLMERLQMLRYLLTYVFFRHEIYFKFIYLSISLQI